MSSSVFKKSLILTSGQAAGLVFQFAVPVFLSRWLEVAEFGTFRQIMLLQWALFFTVSLGMENTLFFFAKRDPHLHNVYSLNVMFTNALMGAAVAVVCFAFREGIGDLLNNPDLATYLPLFALYILIALPNQQLDQYIVILGKIKFAALFNFAQIMANSIAVLVGYYFFDSLEMVLWFMIGYEALKTVVLLIMNLRRRFAHAFSFADQWSLLREQMVSSLPVGVTNIVVVLLRLDRLLISAMFNLRQFTIYSVGCLDVPLMGTLTSNLHDVLSIDVVGEGKGGDLSPFREGWLRTIRQIIILAVPLLVFLAVFSEDVMITIFSSKYVDSADYFRVYMFITLLTYLDPELLFRAIGLNRQSMSTQVMAFVYTVGAVVGLGLWGGPLWALLGKGLADFLTLVRRCFIMGRHLQLSPFQFIPVGFLTGVVLTSFMATAIAVVLSSGMPWLGVDSSLVRLLILGPVYGVLCFAAAQFLPLLHADEKAWLKSVLFWRRAA